MKVKYSIIFISVLLLLGCRKDSDSNIDCSANVENAIECEAEELGSAVSGFIVNYYADSTIESEGNYVQGVPEGFWKFYYPDGTLKKEGNYTNKKIDGFWKLYYESGNLKEEGNYYQCTKNGFWNFYYDQSGYAIESSGHFNGSGEKEGTWKYYDTNGDLITEEACP